MQTDRHALNEIRTYDPSVRGSENSSCLGYATTVIGSTWLQDVKPRMLIIGIVTDMRTSYSKAMGIILKETKWKSLYDTLRVLSRISYLNYLRQYPVINILLTF
jgi:hypothetical protein